MTIIWNLKGNNLPLLLSINTFRLEGGFNSLLGNNNNNNPLLKGLDLNIVVLVNILIELNLTERYFSRKGSFIKLIEFAKTETENLNE